MEKPQKIIIEATPNEIIELDFSSLTRLTVANILSAVAQKIKLPPGVVGTLIIKKTGKPIPPLMTLGEAGIEDNEVLIADFERTAGIDTQPTGNSTIKGQKFYWHDSKQDDLTSTHETRVSIPFHGPIEVGSALEQIQNILVSFDGLYTQLALIHTNDINEALQYDQNVLSFKKVFYSRLSHYDMPGAKYVDDFFAMYRIRVSEKNPLFEFNKTFLETRKIFPLSITAITKGSIEIDLLGVGKILDFIEHSVKQLRWEADHEKQMANSTRRKSLLEEQLLGEQLLEANLVNEEKNLAVVAKKLDLVRQIQELDLPIEQKRKLVNSVLSKAGELRGVTISRIRKRKAKPKLPKPK